MKVTFMSSGKNVPDVVDDTLHVELSDGAILLIEMFERKKGQIDISTKATYAEGIVIKPVAGNRVSIGSERDKA